MFGWTSSKCVCVFKRPWKKNETSTYWSPKTNTQRKRNVYFFLLRVSFLFIWFTSYWSLSIGNILFFISMNEFVVSSCSDHRPHAKSRFSSQIVSIGQLFELQLDGDSTIGWYLCWLNGFSCSSHQWTNDPKLKSDFECFFFFKWERVLFDKVKFSCSGESKGRTSKLITPFFRFLWREWLSLSGICLWFIASHWPYIFFLTSRSTDTFTKIENWLLRCEKWNTAPST